MQLFTRFGRGFPMWRKGASKPSFTMCKPRAKINGIVWPFYCMHCGKETQLRYLKYDKKTNLMLCEECGK